MKKALFVSLLSTVALLSARVQAQVLCTLGPATPYDSMSDMPASGSPPADLKKLKSLLCPKGCGKLFLFANPTSPNTATVSDGSGTSKISYSPGFVESVRTSYGPVATLGIFAHDLGHHLEATGNRPSWMQSSWDSELRADAWAGCAMAKAELKPSGLQAVVAGAVGVPVGETSRVERAPARHHRGIQAVWWPDAAAAGQGSPRAGRRRDHDREQGRRRQPGGVGGRLQRRQGLPPGTRVREQPMRRRARAPALRQGHRLPRSAGVQRGRRLRAVPPVRWARQQEAAPAKEAGPMLASAALQTQRPAASPAASDSAACLKTCDEVRNLCVDAATSEGNKCVATIQSDPGYRACSCASFPNVNNECHAFCASAHEPEQRLLDGGTGARLPRRRRSLPRPLPVAPAPRPHSRDFFSDFDFVSHACISGRRRSVRKSRDRPTRAGAGPRPPRCRTNSRGRARRQATPPGQADARARDGGVRRTASVTAPARPDHSRTASR